MAAVLLWVAVLLVAPVHAAQAGNLNIHTTNAQSGQPLVNLEVHAFESGPQGELVSWRNRGFTNSDGMVSLELPGLGAGKNYVLLSAPYNGGYAISDTIDSAGNFEYRLGALQVTVTNGDDNSVLANHAVGALEVLPDGSTKWAMHGTTDANGLILFDLPGLGDGRNYILHATRPWDDSYFASKELTQAGPFQFKVGHPLLNANVVDGVSGQPLPGQDVHFFQKQQTGDPLYLGSGVTDSNGRIDFEIAQTGAGISYELVTDVFNSVPSYSEAITASGDFTFRVGKLKVTAVSGADGSALANHTVGAMERLPDGSDKAITQGLTDSNGNIRFDLPGLGQGRSYVLYAASPVDGTIKKSAVLNANGATRFSVGSKALNVTLTNGISGATLGQKLIAVLATSPDGKYRVVAAGTTDNNGNISFDVDELAQGEKIILLTVPYNGGWVLSNEITQYGDTQFTVGQLPVRLRDADTGQNMAGQTLYLMEKMDNGELTAVATGTTNGQGVVTFDTPKLGTGVSYSVFTQNVFGQNKQYFSPWITSSGQVDFLVAADADQMFDNMPPELQVLSPMQGQDVSAGGFIVEGTVSDDRQLEGLVIEVIDENLGSSSQTIAVQDGRWSHLVAGSSVTGASSLQLNVTASDHMGNETTVHVDLNAIADSAAPQLLVNSHSDQDTVSSAGFLLTGTATDNLGLQQVSVTLVDSVQGTLLENSPLSIAPNSGSWALPVEPAAGGRQLQLTIVASDFDGHVSSKVLQLNVVDASAGVEHLISRITYGATPELLDETRGQDAAVFKAQQLDWASIDESELDSMIMMMGMPTSTSQLQDYQMMRALYAKRQLLEKMTWFWENHFNTDLGKTGSVEYELRENELFRTHALGKFRDLLQVSATSPAMLIYLDGVSNFYTDPNENYARELMELHTLGVDGGYSESDVAQVARVFTGWAVKDNQFHVYDQYHDTDEKTILGHTFGSNSGLEEGNQLLDLLASHPSTAEHMCTKLLQYLVSDVPDAGSVGGCASVFLNSDGDIGQVVSWILDSPAFNSAGEFKSKAKTPMEFVAGMIRGLAPTMIHEDIRLFLYTMGMPTFYCPPPTGWSEVGADWINAEQLGQRLQATNYLLFSNASYGGSYMGNLADQFVSRGLETQDAVLGHLAQLTHSGSYSDTAWEEAKNALTDGSQEFDINAEDVDSRLRAAMAVMFNAPGYHLQ